MASYLHSQLSTFRDAGKYCDLTVIVEDEEFLCHRLVLTAVYKYFDTMFGGTFKEGHMNKITLHDVIKASPFKAILDYAYTGREPSIDIHNVLDILRTSDFLGASTIVESCVQFIRNNSLSLKNAMEVYRFASAVNMTSLLECFGERYIQNLKMISERDTFNLRTSLNDISLLLSEYQKPPATFKTFLHIKDVDFALDLLLRWICHSREERAPHFEELSRFVDFKHVSAEYMKVLSAEYGLRCDDNTSLKKCLVDYFNREPGERTVPARTFLGVLPSSTNINLSTIHAFVKYPDPRSAILSLNERRINRMWDLSSTKIICQFPFTNVRSVQLRDNLYFYGGDDFNENPSSFLVFQTIEDVPDNFMRALSCPPCTSPKFDMCATREGVLFWYNTNLHNHANYTRSNLPMHSGCETFREEEQIQRGLYLYNTHLDKWFSVPKMKKTVAKSCMTADDSRLYLIGGRDEEGRDLGGYAQAFDYRTPKWQELPKTVETYCDAASCTLDGKIYVSDGEVLETYDSVAGKWMVASSRDDSKSTENEKKIFNKKRMVPFRNLLWEFNFDEPNRLALETNIIDPYDDQTPKYWRTSPSLQEAIQSWALKFASRIRGADPEDDDSSSSSSFDECDDVSVPVKTDILDIVVF